MAPSSVVRSASPRRQLVRLAHLTLIAVALTACNESSAAERGAMLGAPIANLDDASLGRFLLGKAVFERIATQEEGLGPLYNEVRCSGCHDVPVVGGAGFDVRVLKATRYADGRCDLLETEGGDNIQQRATSLLVERGITREDVPESATARSLLTAPPLFGLGLVEAVSAQAIAERADPDDRDGDGISGRVALAADGMAGRFGRKGDLATIEGFVDTALRFEMGLTTPGHPREESINGGALPEGADPIGEPEIEHHGVQALSEFARYLAPPQPAPLSGAARDSVQQGERFFSEAGCANCHVPEMRTSREAPGRLANVAVRMYSDLLLHDLGPALADVCGSSASPAEWLTARLWGLRFRTRFLHDGRATDVTQAILSHGGEATAARDAFSALDARQRALLLRFLAAI